MISEETRRKMSEAQKRRTNRPWLGKKLPQWMKDKIRATKEKNGTVTANSDFFKTHKFEGENNKNWKGKDVSYAALHHWVKRQFGAPEKCEFCKKTEKRSGYIQWANKSGEYERAREDWIRLCAKCHYHYDRNGRICV